jgi:hypothetical protein
MLFYYHFEKKSPVNSTKARSKPENNHQSESERAVSGKGCKFQEK